MKSKKELKREARHFLATQWGKNEVQDYMVDCKDFRDYLYNYANGDREDAMDMMITNQERNYSDTGGYLQSVLPELRQMAGCKDYEDMKDYDDCTEEQKQFYSELREDFFGGFDAKMKEELDGC